MNFLKIYLIILTLFFTFSVSAQERSALPDIELKTIDGKTVHLHDYHNEGKPTYIIFWATWGGPTKKQLDDLNEYYEDWKIKFNVNIVAVSVDDLRTNSKVKSTVDAKGWEYQILCDPNQNSYQKLNFTSVPQSLLLDKKGKITYSLSGYNEGDLNKIEDELIKLANE